MRKVNFKTTLLSSGMALLSACGPLNNLSDMHDSTAEMNKNMKSMLGTMAHMDTGMSDMSTKMDSLPAMQKGMDGMSTKMDALPAMQKSMDTLTAKMDLLTDMNETMKSLGKNMDGMSNKMDALPAMLAAMNLMSTKMDALPAMNAAMGLMSTKMDSLPAMLKAMEVMTARMDLLKTMNDTMITLGTNMTAMSVKMDALPAMLEAMKTMTKRMDLLTDMNNSMQGLITSMGEMSKKMDSLPEMQRTMAEMSTKMDSLTAMKLAMDGMSKKMDALPEMNDNMKNLTGYIKKMNDTLNLTYADLRLIFTTQHQVEALKAMEDSTDQSAKFGYAAEYMVSQTYQGWNANAESPQVRLNLMGISVPSFFFKMTNYMGNRTKTGPAKKDNDDMNLYAIGATLDYINTVELAKLKYGDGRADAVQVTMNSMIEDGLRLKGSVDSGKVRLADLPVYKQEVLNHEQDAIYLLRIRQNFLKGVVISIAKQHASGNPKTTAGLFIDMFKSIFTGTIGQNLDAQNVSEIEILAQGLDKAAETEQFLLDQKLDPQNDGEAALFLRKLAPADIDSRGSSAEIEHFNRALRQIVALDNRQ